MSEENKRVKELEEAIEKIENKESNLYFFVYDTKGVPAGSLAYIYETALYLYEKGYNVKMVHAEKEDFVGVRSWLGDKYADLPHFNNGTDKLTVGPADFIFIPEIYSTAMSATKSVACRKVVILQNFRYMSEIIPVGVSWSDLNIHDCITTSDSLKNRVLEFFPGSTVNIVHPAIQDYFHEGKEPKKLIINVVSKSPSDIEAIIKPFYWKYPNYSWVAFRNVANLPREPFADALRESVATIWCDNKTDFGYDAVEAMASGSIVIGKIPDNEPEWLEKEGVLKDNGLWFFKYEDAADIIASVIESFISDTLPDVIYDEMRATVSEYSVDRQHKEIDTVYGDLFNETSNALKIILNKYKESNNG